MIVVLNLKMHMSLSTILEYEKFIHDKEVIVLPQFPYMPYFHNAKYSLGAQDVSKYNRGSYTGEVCAKAIKGIGGKYVLIGHSERKKYFNESLLDIKSKITNANDAGLIPIVCINQNEENKEFKDIDEQIQYIPDYVRYVMIAYEPDWLIGSEKTINLDYLQSAITKIKECLMERNINHSIIYGGNVNSSNIESIVNVAGIDGVIMSTSALSIDELKIILEKYK